MDDPVDPVAGKRSGERVGIAKIDIYKGEQFAIACVEMRDARMFEIERVIGCKIVDADDALAATEQGCPDVHSDEPGRAGNKRRQISSPCRPLAFAMRSKPFGRCVGLRAIPITGRRISYTRFRVRE